MEKFLQTGWVDLLIFLVRIFIAGFCGAFVGMERQQEHKPAGTRTLSLVSMGAALFMIISLRLSEQMMVDVTRIPAQIVTGIGFLGAGAIIRERGTVKGLTTAAGVWIVAAIGMAVGAGMYFEGIAATILAYFILAGLPKFLQKK
jgi:putative Mg2+ transporter-C (MgtC) family protein